MCVCDCGHDECPGWSRGLLKSGAGTGPWVDPGSAQERHRGGAGEQGTSGFSAEMEAVRPASSSSSNSFHRANV